MRIWADCSSVNENLLTKKEKQRYEQIPDYINDY